MAEQIFIVVRRKDDKFRNDNYFFIFSSPKLKKSNQPKECSLYLYISHPIFIILGITNLIGIINVFPMTEDSIEFY